MGIITKVVKQSHGIIRSDNQATSGEKAHLWEVPLDSEFVVEAVTSVRHILRGNLDAVEKVLGLYAPYLFLLTDRSKVERFVGAEKRRTMAQYSDYIKSFEKTSDAIRKELPGEVQMSGFLVNCSEVNEGLIRECNDVYKEALMRAMAESIITADAERITGEFNAIKARITVKIESAAQCIDVEEEIEKARMERIPALLEEYSGVRAWLRLLHSVEHIFPATSNSLNKVMRSVIEVHKLANEIESCLD